MESTKLRSLESLEKKMEGVDENSLRYHILQNAKNFKTSWIELGRALYTVSKDKLYKEWGYSSFDIYTVREIGIRKQTAMKLVRSYYFLEKEEPLYLKKDYVESTEAASIPSYESVDVLRQAKNKKVLDEDGYAELKKEVFEKGKDVRDVKQNLAVMIKQREELEPEEAREKKKDITVKRFLSTLKALKKEIEILKLLPSGTIREMDSLIVKIEAEVM